MQENVGFLQDARGDIIDVLRLTEGVIFKDEGAKILFLDTKYFVLDSLQTKWRIMDKEAYEEELSDIIVWSEKREQEECARASQEYPGIADRLTEVTLLYAKYLFVKQDGSASSISIRKPKVGTLLRGMFTRLCRMHQVRNGAFFDLTPMNQDFVLRDVFRHTLSAECMRFLDEEDKKTGDDVLSILSEKNVSKDKSTTSVHQTTEKEFINSEDDDSKSINSKFESKSVVTPLKNVVDVPSSSKSVVSEITVLSTLKESKAPSQPLIINSEDTQDGQSTLTRSNFPLQSAERAHTKSSNVQLQVNEEVDDLEDEEDDEDVYPNDSISVRGSQYISTFPSSNMKQMAKTPVENMSMYTKISSKSAPSSAASSSQYRKPKIVHIEEGFNQ